MDYEQIAQEVLEYKVRTELAEFHPTICSWAAHAIRELIRERDAALEMLRGECRACKHNCGWCNVGECKECIHESDSGCDGKESVDKWEWIGIKEK